MKNAMLYAYSAFAASFIAIPMAKGQFYNQDYSPDTLLSPDFVYCSDPYGSSCRSGIRELDLDPSGSMDFAFSMKVCAGTSYSPCSPAAIVKLLGDSLIEFASGPSYWYSAPGVAQLSVGETVGNSQNFITCDPCRVFQVISSSGSDYTYGNWPSSKLVGSIGIKVSINSSWHYGWIRCERPSWSFGNIIVMDHLLNKLPGAPVTIGSAGPDSGVTSPSPLVIGCDQGFTGTSADIMVSFDVPSGETGIGAYLICLVPSSALPLFDITQVESLAPNQFVTRIADGSDHNFLFPPAMNDIDGNTIVEGVAYNVVVVSAANGAAAGSSQYSVSTSFELGPGTDSPKSIPGPDPGDTDTE